MTDKIENEMENLITICITFYNDEDFIINTLYCLQRITKNGYKVIIRDNNSKWKNYLKLKKEIKKYPNVELYRVENLNCPSDQWYKTHGIALNDLVKKIDTKYGVILDADCTFLYKNWDAILINEISEKYPIIGTQAVPGYAGKRDTEFPLMFAILFDMNIMKTLDIDFIAVNPKEGLDTGYQLKEKYLRNGYKGKILQGRNTRDYKLGLFRNFICEEYYLSGINDVFACHFGRGHSSGRAKYIKKKTLDKDAKKKIIYFIPILGKIFLKLKGKRQKKKWIKICRNIVNKV